MRLSWKVYALAGIILCLSFVGSMFTTETLRVVISLPGVAALIAALIQIVRDQAEYQRRLWLQENQQIFSLGVTSHMAEVAFDRHVQFSEQYIKKMQEGLEQLLKTGGSHKDALQFCCDLADVRLSFRAWLTEDLQAKVIPFENALREMGASGIALQGLPVGEQRNRVLAEMDRIFSNVTGFKLEGPIDENLTPGRIMNHLQETLGVKQLIRLRGAVIAAAIEALEKRG